MSRRECKIAARLVDALNGRDFARIREMISDDFLIVDSQNESQEGGDAAVRLLQRLFKADPTFWHDIEQISWSNGMVLMRGYVRSEFEGLTGRVYWQLDVKDRKVTRWQSFRDNPPSMVKLFGDN